MPMIECEHGYDHCPKCDEPTSAELRAAAARWQGNRLSPLCEDNSAYFISRWRDSPAMRRYVETEIANRNTAQ